MSVAKTVLRNVASSWVGLASQVAVTFLLTPFVIARLGLEAYGVWLLLQSTVGYYGMVDMGLRAGLTQSITRRIARGDIEGVRRHLGAAIPILSVLGLVVMLFGLALCWLLPETVGMSAQLRQGLWAAIFIQALSVSVQMPLAAHSAILIGLERYDIANAISVATRVLSALLSYATLALGGGLIGLSVVLLLTNATDSLIRCWVATALLPAIRRPRLTWDRSELREIANVGVWNFLIHISRQLIYFTDALTVGFLFSAATVAPFGIASSLIEYGNRLVILSTRVLFPTMSTLRERGNLSALRVLYLTATRITLATSITITLVGSFWIAPFLELWLGTSSENRLIHAQAPSLFVALGIAFSFVSLQRSGTQLWLADNRLPSLALALAAEAILNLLLSLWLGWQIGVMGVAIGTAIPAALLCFFVHLPMHARILKMSIARTLTLALLRPALYSLLLAPILYLLARWLPGDESWSQLFLAGILSVLLSGLCACVLLSRQQVAALAGRVFQIGGKAIKPAEVISGSANHA